MFFTRLGDAREVIRSICGDTIADKTMPIWGLDAEGEASSVWRGTGVPNMWYAFGKHVTASTLPLSGLKWVTGNLAMCRFQSRHLALRGFRSTTFDYLPLIRLSRDQSD